jgi:fructosamine-3-kinase
MSPELARALEVALGGGVASSRPLAGGDVNRAYAVRLRGGAEVFVKTHPAAPPGLYEAEARGLAFLAEARALPVPKVVAFTRAGDRGPAFLALELLRPGPRAADFDAELGRGIAALHSSWSRCASAPLHHTTAPAFGLDHDNFIGPLSQDNRPRPSWAAFWAEARLLPMAERAAREAALPRALERRIERLAASLPARLGPDEPPSRLHGDLWSGNVHVTPSGDPCLIDPAVYGGDREVDLAMLELFGRPGRHFFGAYDEVYPRREGYEARRPLYQLYPLLVHVRLFGGGYVGSVEGALDALGAG